MERHFKVGDQVVCITKRFESREESLLYGSINTVVKTKIMLFVPGIGFWSFVVSGCYLEEIYSVREDGLYFVSCELRREGSSHFVNAKTVHKIIDLPEGKCETLILPGPWEREWGMWSFKDGKATFIKQ